MKKLFAATLLLCTFTVLGLLTINQEAIRKAGEQKAMERVARARATTHFVEWLYSSFLPDILSWIVYFLIFTAFVVVTIVFIGVMEKRWKNRNTAHNGIFPLVNQAIRLADGSRATLTTNPNILLAPQFITVHAGLQAGSYQIAANMSEAGQLHAMQIGRAANNLQATPSTGMGSRLYNAMQQPPRPMRVIGSDEPAPAAPALPMRPMAVSEAFQRSTDDTWILGRSMSGDLASFSTNDHTHCAIFGATGTGKTYGSGVMMLAHALRLGWRTLILDGKGGDDWSAFAELSEYHEVYPEVFPNQVSRLVDEYNRRMKGESEKHPMLIVIEEYGAINDSMLRNQASVANGGLMKLIRLGRAARMHLCFIDQYPDRWEPQLIQNTKLKIVYWLADGSIVKEYHAHKTARRGEFLVDGQPFKSFDMRPHVERLLELAAPVRYPMLIDGTAQAVKEDEQEEESGEEENVWRETSGGKWDDWFKRYVARHPEVVAVPTVWGAQAAAAKVMALEAGEGKSYTDYKSTISELVKVWRENEQG